MLKVDTSVRQSMLQPPPSGERRHSETKKRTSARVADPSQGYTPQHSETRQECRHDEDHPGDVMLGESRWPCPPSFRPVRARGQEAGIGIGFGNGVQVCVNGVQSTECTLCRGLINNSYRIICHIEAMPK